MPANRLTKILLKQTFTEFVRQLSLVDITKRLTGLHRANRDDLNAIYIH
jgi:hypothetical protein